MKDPIAEEISIKEFYKRTNDLKNCDDMASCKVGLNNYYEYERWNNLTIGEINSIENDYYGWDKWFSERTERTSKKINKHTANRYLLLDGVEKPLPCHVYFKFTSSALAILFYKPVPHNIGKSFETALDVVYYAKRDGKSEYDTSNMLNAKDSDYIKNRLLPYAVDNQSSDTTFKNFIVSYPSLVETSDNAKDVVVLDVETNGLRTALDDLLSLSIYNPSSGEIYNRFFPLDLQPIVLTQWINGIKDEDLRSQQHMNQKEFDDIFSYFDLGNKYILVYSGSYFDQNVISNYLKRHKIKGAEKLQFYDIKTSLVEEEFGGKNIYLSKDNICKELNISGVNDVHTSANDCILEWKIYNTLKNKKISLSCSEDGVLNIPEDFKELRNINIKNPANIKSIIFPKSISYISKNTFSNCSNIEEITIDSDVVAGTPLSCIFPLSITKIKKVNFGSNVRSIRNIFACCKNIEHVTIAEDNQFYISTENEIFTKDKKTLVCLYKNKTEEYTIPSSVSLIETRAFEYNDKITSIKISNNIISIGFFPFYKCRNLSSIVIDSNAFTTMKSLFGFGEDPTWVTKVTIGEHVTSIKDGAFEGCSGLTAITIPDSVTSIGKGAFEGCTGLSSIAIPSSVTSIADDAFHDCCSLGDIIIPKNVITVGDNAFANIKSRSRIYCECSDKPEGWSANWKSNGAIVHWYSESEAYGKWHYVDGKPVCWHIVSNCTKLCSDKVVASSPKKINRMRALFEKLTKEN
jgi:DNA polymerase III epsilon subunit-like protein